jgi:hypothetical protein
MDAAENTRKGNFFLSNMKNEHVTLPGINDASRQSSSIVEASLSLFPLFLSAPFLL